jgi:hypothetical protein
VTLRGNSPHPGLRPTLPATRCARGGRDQKPSARSNAIDPHAPGEGSCAKPRFLESVRNYLPVVGQISSRFAAGRATCKHRQAQNPLRVKSNFARDFNVIWVVQSPREKYSACAVGQIKSKTRAIPRSIRGALRTSSTWSAGCDGRGMSLDEGRCARTAKPCGPDAPTLASSRRRCSSIAPMTVARKPGHRGEHGGSR